jgi:hypothetical protein
MYIPGPPGAGGGRGQSLAMVSKRRLIDGVAGAGGGLMMSMATMTSTPIASGISSSASGPPQFQPRPTGGGGQQQPWMPQNTPRGAPGLGYNNNPYGPR